MRARDGERSVATRRSTRGNLHACAQTQLTWSTRRVRARWREIACDTEVDAREPARVRANTAHIVQAPCEGARWREIGCKHTGSRPGTRTPACGGTLVVDHADGRVMVGRFDSVVHEGVAWNFERYVISFYTNAQILTWFERVQQREREGRDTSWWL